MNKVLDASVAINQGNTYKVSSSFLHFSLNASILVAFRVMASSDVSIFVFLVFVVSFFDTHSKKILI